MFFMMLSDNYPFSEVLDAHPLYPPYYKYDEEDVSKLSFDIFHGMKKVWFKEANEYTITIARILLILLAKSLLR